MREMGKWEKQIYQKMGEANSGWESIVTITEDELTFLIISSIHMLKRNEKKCGRIEVYNLVQESVEFKISSGVFKRIEKEKE